MKTRFKVLIIGLLLSVASPAFTQKYILDAGHSSFQTQVMRFGVVPVVGRFNEVSGELYFDQANIEEAKVSITIEAASYEANNNAGEEAVKSSAFLDVSNFPKIYFQLSAIQKIADNYLAKGTLEIHGTKREVECPVSIVGPSLDLPTRKPSIGVTGNLTIDRTAYGVGKEMKLPNGEVIIGNTVNIDFVILGIEE